MFKYLPSVENALPVAAGAVDGKQYDSPLSAYFAQSVNYDAINGIIDSVVCALNARGMSNEDINEKIRALVDTLKSHGDLNENETEWLLNRDYSKSYESQRTYEISELECDGGRCIYDGYWGIKRSAMSGIACISKWSESLRKQQLNEREQALVENLKEAERAYYNARDAFEKYTWGCAIDAINDLFTKYADDLRKLDNDWYERVTSSLKYDVERLKKEREAKKLEKDSAVNRPVKAE